MDNRVALPRQGQDIDLEWNAYRLSKGMQRKAYSGNGHKSLDQLIVSMQDAQRRYLANGRMCAERRRAQKYGNTPTEELLTKDQWEAKLDEYGYRCAYCGKELDETTVTIEHVIPLNHGGRHSKENVVPACIHCNSSKQDRTPEEWGHKVID